MNHKMHKTGGTAAIQYIAERPDTDSGITP